MFLQKKKKSGRFNLEINNIIRYVSKYVYMYEYTCMNPLLKVRNILKHVKKLLILFLFMSHFKLLFFPFMFSICCICCCALIMVATPTTLLHWNFFNHIVTTFF